MLDRKDKKGKCPFRKMKECSEECVLYRKGTRYNEKTDEVFSVELCAFNVIADNLENMHNRTYMLQKEVGETKNVVAFGVMANMGITTREEAEKQAKKVLMPVIEEIQRNKELPEK